MFSTCTAFGPADAQTGTIILAPRPSRTSMHSSLHQSRTRASTTERPVTATTLSDPNSPATSTVTVPPSSTVSLATISYTSASVSTALLSTTSSTSIASQSSLPTTLSTSSTPYRNRSSVQWPSLPSVWFTSLNSTFVPSTLLLLNTTTAMTAGTHSTPCSTTTSGLPPQIPLYGLPLHDHAIPTHAELFKSVSIYASVATSSSGTS